MNRKDFDKIVAEAVEEHTWGGDTDQLEIKWETGGMSGGNCWDDSNPQSYTASEVEPEFVVLDVILEKVCPAMTYLQYKALEREIDTDSYTEHEYYGNNTNYGRRRLSVNDLWKFLVARGYCK